VDAAYTYGRLSKSLPSASEAAVTLTRRLAGSEAVTLGVHVIRQFDQSDTLTQLTDYRSWGYWGLGGTPNARFSPQVEVHGGMSFAARPIGKGWTVRPGVDASWARYPVGPVTGLHPSLLFSRDDVVTLQARWVNVLDERDRYLTGYALRAGVRPRDGLQLSLGWSEAPESSEGVTMKVRELDAGAALDVGARTTLRLFVSHAKRPAYDRDDVTVGVGRKF
jgi:YaiO family outer membrane protein